MYIVLSVMREVCVGYCGSAAKGPWFSAGGSMGVEKKRRRVTLEDFLEKLTRPSEKRMFQVEGTTWAKAEGVRHSRGLTGI